MKKGVISYGEAFIDYIAKDSSNLQFKQYLGGTTLNVAVGVQRLGTPAYYLCKLGTNPDSHFIVNGLKQAKVNQDFCIESTKKRICGVNIYLNTKGERYFHSYVNETPDEQHLPSELDEELFKETFLFYFGSGTLFHQQACETTQTAINLAKKHHILIAFDVNIRMKRWDSEQLCRSTILDVLPSVDIVKLTGEELCFLMESSTIHESIRKLSVFQVPYTWITLGENGALAIHGGDVIHVPAEKVRVVDTTGAGDMFMSAIIHRIHTDGLPVNDNDLVSYTTFANKLGGLTATKLGALTAFSIDSLED